jgi:hypothetical protein
VAHKMLPASNRDISSLRATKHLLDSYTTFCQRISNEGKYFDGKRICVEIRLRIVVHVIRGLEVSGCFADIAKKLLSFRQQFEFLTNLIIPNISEDHTTQICCLFFKRFPRWKIDSCVDLQVRILQ